MSEEQSSPLAAYIKEQIKRSPKTQGTIASEAGFASPSMISMIQSGETKLPISRIPALANSLGLDPKKLLRMALNEQYPDVGAMVEGLRENTGITEAELRLLRGIREASGGTEADFSTPEVEDALRKVLSQLDGGTGTGTT